MKKLRHAARVLRVRSDERGCNKTVAIIYPSTGPRLCSAQRNQPQRSLPATAIRTNHALRLVSDTAAVRGNRTATVLFYPL